MAEPSPVVRLGLVTSTWRGAVLRPTLSGLSRRVECVKLLHEMTPQELQISTLGVGSNPLLQASHSSSSSSERSPSLPMASSLGRPPPGTKPSCSLVRPSNHYFSKRSTVHLGVHAIVSGGEQGHGINMGHYLESALLGKENVCR